MRLAAATIIIGCPLAAPALAQDVQPARDPLQTVSAIVTRPGSPSNGTATVSPSSVPQNMDRFDDPTSAFSASVGTLYAVGNFGSDTNTSIWSSAIAARYRMGDLRLTASLPWMRIRSNAVIFTGIDSTPVLVAPSASAALNTAKGSGDLTLGAAYTFAPEGAGLEVELSGRAKLNTATRSSKLSSGEKDYAAGVQITRLLGEFGPFVSATYRVLGDTSNYRLRNGLAASAGTSLAVGSRSYLLASYHYSERATDFVEDAHEVFAGAVTEIPNTRMRFSGFGTLGLSRGAAAASAGLALSRDF